MGGNYKVLALQSADPQPSRLGFAGRIGKPVDRDTMTAGQIQAVRECAGCNIGLSPEISAGPSTNEATRLTRWEVRQDRQPAGRLTSFKSLSA